MIIQYQIYVSICAFFISFVLSYFLNILLQLLISNRTNLESRIIFTISNIYYLNNAKQCFVKRHFGNRMQTYVIFVIVERYYLVESMQYRHMYTRIVHISVVLSRCKDSERPPGFKVASGPPWNLELIGTPVSRTPPDP